MFQIFSSAIIQIIAVFFVIKYFIIDQLSQDKIFLIFQIETLFLFIYLIVTKFFLTYLFSLILNIISNKKNSYLDINNIFLQGGIINQLIPGAGYIFKYYKLKSNSSISLAEYTISQGIWSFNSLFAYLVLGFLSGIIIISGTDYFSILIFFLLIITILLFIIRKKIYKLLIKFKKVKNIYLELRKIKEIIKNNLLKFFIIFLGFLVLASLECFGFYLSLIVFGAENLTFLTANYTYITSSLASVLVAINYFGVFEVILTISANFIMPNFEDMIIYGVAFRVVNTSALIASIVISFILTIFYKKSSS